MVSKEVGEPGMVRFDRIVCHLDVEQPHNARLLLGDAEGERAVSLRIALLDRRPMHILREVLVQQLHRVRPNAGPSTSPAHQHRYDRTPTMFWCSAG
jgi:hypothetical protein